jgi:hypothetical protein
MESETLINEFTDMIGADIGPGARRRMDAARSVAVPIPMARIGAIVTRPRRGVPRGHREGELSESEVDEGGLGAGSPASKVTGGRPMALSPGVSWFAGRGRDAASTRAGWRLDAVFLS